MQRTFFVLAAPLVLALPVDALAASSTSPGYTPSQIQAPPQFNGGATTTAPSTAPIRTAPAAPVVVPRRR